MKTVTSNTRCRWLLELSRSIADTCDSRLHIISLEYYLESYLNNAWIKLMTLNLPMKCLKLKWNISKRCSAVEESGISGEMVYHLLHGKADDQIRIVLMN